MLIPRFSIKLMFALTAGFAVFFLTARQAVGGQTWAMAIVTLVGLAAALFALFAALFLVAYFFSALGRRKEDAKTQSPFAADRLPPQVIPPREIDNS